MQPRGSAADRMRVLHVNLLGPITADVDGVPVALGSPKQRAVLAVLALNAGRAVSTDRLLDELWGPTAGESALVTLRSLVSRIRSALNAAAPGSGQLVVLRRPGYLLDIAPSCLDSRRFSAQVVRAQAELDGGEPVTALASLDQALAWVRDEPLVDVREHLGEASRADLESLDEAVLAARRLRVQALLDSDQAAAAVTDSAGLVQRHPLDEGLALVRMKALAATHRVADALALYDWLRRGLAESFGVSPQPALQDLFVSLLDAPQVQAVAGPPSADLLQDPDRPGEADGLPGRERELAELQGAVHRCADGIGSVWLIAGPAGIGRTSVAHEVERMARAAGLDVLAVAIPPDQAHRAGPVAAAFRDLVGMPRDAEFEDVVRAITRPTAVVIDDLHWSIDVLLDRLRGIGGLAHGRPLLLVCTSAEVGDAAVRRGLDLGFRTRVLELSDLTEDAVGAVLDEAVHGDAAADAATVHRLTGGNPLLTRVAARALTEGARPDPERPPGEVAAVLQRWLGQLPADVERVLQSAAAIGSVIAVDLLVRVTGLDPAVLDDALAAAEAAGLVVRFDDHRSLRWRHGWMAAHLRSRITPMARARMHLTTARAMVDAPSTDPDELVHQLVASGGLVAPQEAAGLLLQASGAARSRREFRTATLHAERARTFSALLPPGGARDELELRTATEYAELCSWTDGRASAASRRAAEHLMPIIRRVEPGGARDRALRVLASHLIATAQYGEALTLAQRMRALRPPAGSPATEAVAGWMAGAVALLRGDLGQAVDELSAVVAAVDVPSAMDVRPPVDARLPPEDLLVWVRAYLALAVTLAGDVSITVGAGREATAAEQVADDSFTHAAAPAWMALMHAMLDDPAAALERARLAVALATEAGFRTWYLLATAIQGWAETLLALPAEPATPSARDDLGGPVRRCAEAVEEWCADGPAHLATVLWGLLAEAQLAVDTDSARASLARANAAAEQTSEQIGRPLLERMAGRLALLEV